MRISREEAEISQKPNPVYCLLLHYIVVGKYSWEALRYFLNCIFKTFIVQNRTSWRHLPLLPFDESWLCGVGFFQCENFDLSRFLTLSQNIGNARGINLRTILSGFCHLAIGWVLLKGFKCFTSAVPQQRKKEPCLEYKVQLQSEK